MADVIDLDVERGWSRMRAMIDVEGWSVTGEDVSYGTGYSITPDDLAYRLQKERDAIDYARFSCSRPMRLIDSRTGNVIPFRPRRP